MRRYALEILLLRRLLRQWKAYNSEAYPVERGRFRKRKPLDCGRARCGCCHAEKVYRRRSVHQRRADRAFRNAVRELP